VFFDGQFQGGAQVRIACVLGPKFEHSEYRRPDEAFRNAGRQVTIVGLDAGAQLEGGKGKVLEQVLARR
jgi:putative intracellular protease/amidase